MSNKFVNDRATNRKKVENVDEVERGSEERRKINQNVHTSFVSLDWQLIIDKAKKRFLIKFLSL